MRCDFSSYLKREIKPQNMYCSSIWVKKGFDQVNIAMLSNDNVCKHHFI